MLKTSLALVLNQCLSLATFGDSWATVVSTFQAHVAHDYFFHFCVLFSFHFKAWAWVISPYNYVWANLC